MQYIEDNYDKWKRHDEEQEEREKAAQLPWNDGVEQETYSARNQIEELLLLACSEDPEGVRGLLKHMEEIGFYEAPCSGGNHLARAGGLAEHSLNVAHYAMLLLKAWYEEPYYSQWADSVILCSLLHDIGKCGQFGKTGYVSNMVKDGRPTKADPEQKYKQSEDKPYKANPELLNVPHEVRSLSIIQQFIELSEDEYYAILYHNGLYGPFYREINKKETALYMILHFADMWCSRIVEREGD